MALRSFRIDSPYVRAPPLILTSLMIISLSSVAYAESVYDIIMPSGSADKTAPFHWISEKGGNTSGFIEIAVNDTIYWKNGDTVAHIISSGNPEDGSDGIFNSDNIFPGRLFAHKFTEVGEFHYYCTIHPWRTGLVSVVSGHNILPNVGSDFEDGKNTFDLEYTFNRIISRANIDGDTKSITFELMGKTINDDNSLTLFLPSALISGISSVSIDGIHTEKFNQEFEKQTIIFSMYAINRYRRYSTD